MSLVTDHNEDAFRRLVRQIDPGGTFRRAWRLGGGVSADVTVVEMETRSGEPRKLLVRRHGEADRARNPNIARDELALLRLAHAHGLAVPRPVHLDESCTLFPTPVLVIEYVNGKTEFAPTDLAAYLAEAAAHLARIHRVGELPELAFLPRQGSGFGPRPAQLDAALGEGRSRDALEAAWPVPLVNRSVLLHGDYWPGNLLWRNGSLVAIIDWEDAHLGDPLADLGNSRLEFLWSFGREAMIELTSRYQSNTAIDTGALPYWDLCAALRPCGKLAGWGLDAATERWMRSEHAWFVTQALAGLTPR